MQNILMFGGGSGTRELTVALRRAGFSTTRIVPAWDSGGSSRALRDALGMLAVGDIRQALMTTAHAEGRVGGVVRFFNARLSEAGTADTLRAEFDFHADGAHPLLGTMPADIRSTILNCLRAFRERIPADFDFRRGSIGNFVLSGAFFLLDRDIDAAIGLFRRLCGIEGHVWPSTTENRVELAALLRDGRRIHGQDRITALPAEAARVGIERVELCIGTEPGRLPPNPAAIDAVARADALLFGPGSFFTSTLPHLLVDGITEAIAARPARVPKILVGNLLECPETTGRTLAELIAAFDAAAGRVLPTHVLANRSWVPYERVLGGHRYLPLGTYTAEPALVADDFEDPWTRGRHDTEKVAATVARLLGPG
jgi:uncharacterized cofD-like protein